LEKVEGEVALLTGYSLYLAHHEGQEIVVREQWRRDVMRAMSE
jgi:hypothetical protein